MILATEMSRHFDILGRFRAKTTGNNEIEVKNYNDKLTLLSMCIKCGDLGHSAKNQSLHVFWTDKVCDEFFTQGDMEKSRGLPISMYCDRETTNIAKSQNGFLVNICIPMFEAISGYLNNDCVSRDVLAQCKENAKFWEMGGKSKSKKSRRRDDRMRRKSSGVKVEKPIEVKLEAPEDR